MKRIAMLLVAASLAFEAGAQNWAPEPRRRAQPAPTPPPASQPEEKRPFAQTRSRDPAAERCESFRRQLRQVARQEAEASTTGAKNQLATRRQQIADQQQRAGC
jgi:hypothetical protein